MLAGATVQQLAEAIERETEALCGPTIHLQEGGSRLPFFFLHGDYTGGGFTASALRLDWA